MTGVVSNGTGVGGSSGVPVNAIERIDRIDAILTDRGVSMVFLNGVEVTEAAGD